MRKIALMVMFCLISIFTFAAFKSSKTAFVRCQALLTVTYVDGSGNVVDQYTWHGYGNSCAEAMADARWRAML
jgi:hypothetical protein